MRDKGAPRRVRRPASSFSIRRADRRRAGEDDALDTAVGDQSRADFARAGHELQRVAWDASLVQHAHGFAPR